MNRSGAFKEVRMTARMIGMVCLAGAVLAVLLVSGCIHADIGNLR